MSWRRTRRRRSRLSAVWAVAPSRALLGLQTHRVGWGVWCSSAWSSRLRARVLLPVHEQSRCLSSSNKNGREVMYSAPASRIFARVVPVSVVSLFHHSLPRAPCLPLFTEKGRVGQDRLREWPLCMEPELNPRPRLLHTHTLKTPVCAAFA